MALDVDAVRRRRSGSPFSPSRAAVRDWRVVSPEGIEPARPSPKGEGRVTDDFGARQFEANAENW
jgi:hypothetical protein